MDTQSLTSLSMDEPGQITSHSQNTDMRVNLLIGERRFTTTRQTLVTESPFFTSLLSGRWGSTLDDGSYFVDADPALFEHILRYLRHSIYPILYDEKWP
jgi:phytoene desaturase (3,4-didehydrolycopene-forming)